LPSLSVVPTRLPRDHGEDLAHIYQTDVLQIRFQQFVPVPANVPLKRFIEELKALCAHWPEELKIHARESTNFPGQPAARAALEKHLQGAGVPRVSLNLMPRYGPRRRDFHDRRVVFVPDIKKPQKRITVLLTGGIGRYLEPRFECGIIVHQTAEKGSAPTLHAFFRFPCPGVGERQSGLTERMFSLMRRRVVEEGPCRNSRRQARCPTWPHTAVAAGNPFVNP
jgi:hypothetical protein